MDVPILRRLFRLGTAAGVGSASATRVSVETDAGSADASRIIVEMFQSSLCFYPFGVSFLEWGAGGTGGTGGTGGRRSKNA